MDLTFLKDLSDVGIIAISICVIAFLIFMRNKSIKSNLFTINKADSPDDYRKEIVSVIKNLFRERELIEDKKIELAIQADRIYNKRIVDDQMRYITKQLNVQFGKIDDEFIEIFKEYHKHDFIFQQWNFYKALCKNFVLDEFRIICKRNGLADKKEDKFIEYVEITSDELIVKIKEFSDKNNVLQGMDEYKGMEKLYPEIKKVFEMLLHDIRKMSIEAEEVKKDEIKKIEDEKEIITEQFEKTLNESLEQLL